MIDKIKENKGLTTISIIVLVVGLYLVFSNSRLINNTSDNQVTPASEIIEQEVDSKPGVNPLNSSYIIEDEVITLTDGVYEEQITDSSTRIVTKVWGKPVNVDINGAEVAIPTLILVQEFGGSGTFYYVAASINVDDGYIGTNGIFLGDRIVIQSQEILDDGTIVINYADREESASMAEEPSVEVSKYFRVESRELIEVESPQN